jgi:hypothetical protein
MERGSVPYAYMVLRSLLNSNSSCCVWLISRYGKWCDCVVASRVVQSFLKNWFVWVDNSVQLPHSAAWRSRTIFPFKTRVSLNSEQAKRLRASYFIGNRIFGKNFPYLEMHNHIKVNLATSLEASSRGLQRYDCLASFLKYLKMHRWHNCHSPRPRSNSRSTETSSRCSMHSASQHPNDLTI